VSFPLRTVLDVVPAGESSAAAQVRDEKRAWLGERDYRVIELRATDIESDVKRVLDRLDVELMNASVTRPSSPES
jgi:tRNA/rRNA methyltransferase